MRFYEMGFCEMDLNPDRDTDKEKFGAVRGQPRRPSSLLLAQRRVTLTILFSSGPGRRRRLAMLYLVSQQWSWQPCIEDKTMATYNGWLLSNDGESITYN